MCWPPRTVATISQMPRPRSLAGIVVTVLAASSSVRLAIRCAQTETQVAKAPTTVFHHTVCIVLLHGTAAADEGAAHQQTTRPPPPQLPHGPHGPHGAHVPHGGPHGSHMGPMAPMGPMASWAPWGPWSSRGASLGTWGPWAPWTSWHVARCMAHVSRCMLHCCCLQFALYMLHGAGQNTYRSERISKSFNKAAKSNQWYPLALEARYIIILSCTLPPCHLGGAWVPNALERG